MNKAGKYICTASTGVTLFGKFFKLNSTLELSEEDKVDAHCDKIVFDINAIEALGYDAEQCMSETIMEISSRRQCPIQKEEWNNSGKSGKWQKDKSQTDTYTAKYSECKRN